MKIGSHVGHMDRRKTCKVFWLTSIISRDIWPFKVLTFSLDLSYLKCHSFFAIILKKLILVANRTFATKPRSFTDKQLCIYTKKWSIEKSYWLFDHWSWLMAKVQGPNYFFFTHCFFYCGCPMKKCFSDSYQQLWD